MLGTHLGNQLKKFMKCEGFYKLVEGAEESDSKEGEGEEEKEVEAEGELEEELMEFKVRVPTLTPTQCSEYIRYKEDDKGNIL